MTTPNHVRTASDGHRELAATFTAEQEAARRDPFGLGDDSADNAARARAADIVERATLAARAASDDPTDRDAENQAREELWAELREVGA